ncbi:THAP domain-containing protein 2 [Microcaecilia unicolor]|uniref:THAP domain-containing protein 2 n=1 Tax=Microcaecilia unicolor TaxID=1415580 RepID=A0A6P7WFR4_9AMPH|nr:THAP domain-containing protein 2 [Microcaecilia unicolor]
MPTSCAAFDCTSAWKKDSNISFHRFPLQAERRKQWIQQVNRQNFTPSLHTFLCSKHFEASCFDRTGQTVRLRHDAVPTLFNFSAHLHPKISLPQKLDVTDVEPLPIADLSTNTLHKQSTCKDHNYCLPSPSAAKRRICELERKLEIAHKKIKIYRQRERRVNRRWTAMNDLVESLKNGNILLSTTSLETLDLENIIGKILS